MRSGCVIRKKTEAFNVRILSVSVSDANQYKANGKIWSVAKEVEHVGHHDKI